MKPGDDRAVRHMLEPKIAVSLRGRSVPTVRTAARVAELLLEPGERLDQPTQRGDRDYTFPVVKPSCTCMTEDLHDGWGERVVTHSRRCPQHPEHDGAAS